MDDDWQVFIKSRKSEELDRIIADEGLGQEAPRQFISHAFRDGFMPESGTAIGRILPAVSRFTPSGERMKKREAVLEKLIAFFNRFRDIS